MDTKISSIAIQTFLNEVKKNKSTLIDQGIIVYPDLFGGNYRNDLFDHRKTKDLLGLKLKEIFSTEWVTVDSGIIKKSRLEEYLHKKSLPLMKGYGAASFVPIARIHKQAGKAKTTNDEIPEARDEIFDPAYFKAKMENLFPQITQTLLTNLEKNGKINSRINLPGVPADIIYHIDKFRAFVKELRPFMKQLGLHLGLDKRKDIIGTVDYYIRRDDGGILKVDVIKNRSHEAFNKAYKTALLKQKGGNKNALKADIQKKRDRFMGAQQEFLQKLEERIFEDNFFAGRNKPENRNEKIRVPEEITQLIEEFPELEKEFFDTFVEKCNMILSSNNITKNDLNIDFKLTPYNSREPETSGIFEIIFKCIENFRITRGIKKYNGIATNLPLEEEDQAALDAAIAKKQRLLDEANSIENLEEIDRLKTIEKTLKALKKEFPLMVIEQQKELSNKIRELEELQRQRQAEEEQYDEIIGVIDSLIKDPSKMENELFNFNIVEGDEHPVGLQNSQRNIFNERTGFVKKLARLAVRTEPTALGKLKSYDAFALPQCITTMHRILLDTFISNSMAEVSETKKETLQAELLTNDALKKSIRNIAEEYYKSGKSSLLDAYAENFMEICGAAERLKDIPPIINEMIEGSRNYRPVLETETGHVTHRADQVMMRVKEATKRKEEVLANWGDKVHTIESKLLKIQFDDKAYAEARALKPERLKRFSAAKIVDVVLNKDGKYNSEKRIFSWLDIPRIKLVLEKLAKAKESKEMESRKAALNGAIRFFESLQSGNTKELLEHKITTHLNQMKKNSKELEKVKAKYDSEADTPLEEFDSDLKKIKKAFVKNFCQPRE